MRTALQVYAVYVFVVGVLLLFPAWASAVFAREVMDAAVTSGWGADLIVLALFAYVASTDVAKYRGLAWVFVVGRVHNPHRPGAYRHQHRAGGLALDVSEQDRGLDRTYSL